MSIKIGIIGIDGKMGGELQKAIEKSDLFTLITLCDLSDKKSSSPSSHRKKDFADVANQASILIDFSSKKALEKLLQAALLYKKPLVIGTTGYTNKEFFLIEKAAKIIPIFYSANFSLGVAITHKLLAITAKYFSPISSIDIIDTHHMMKKDAPSGTALALVSTIEKSLKKASQNASEKKSSKASFSFLSIPEINTHSIREGQIIGKHETIFHTPKEQITITHEAIDRSCFAQGALSAAKFLLNKTPSLYSMEDLIESFEKEGFYENRE